MDYNIHGDIVDNYYKDLGRADDEYWNSKGFDYTANRDKITDDQWQKEFDYTQDQDKIANDLLQKQYDALYGDKDDDDTGNNPKPSPTPDPDPEPVTPDYSSWDQGDWEGYFAAIRQSEGQAAAEEELRYFTSKGLIPNSMVAYAAIGARGGMKGH